MAATVVILSGLLAGAARAGDVGATDWPQFRGPRHDGISAETGFAKSWPPSGLPIIWSREVGAGFSSFAVVRERVYTCGTVDARQVLFCLDFDNGDVIWKDAYEAEIRDPDPHLHGPRATPTVDGDRVYMMGGHGRVVCWNAADGRVLWDRRFTNEPGWGYSASVLMEGDLAIVQAGGADGALCAMDKMTGEIKWRCGDDPAAYATPYPFTLLGRRCVVGFLAQSVIIADAETGKLMLRFEWPSHSGVNVCAPMVHDGCLLLSTGYGYGAGLFRLRPADGGLAADEIWRSTKIRNKFQSPVLVDGKLYTSDEDALKCVDFMTGERLWRKRGIKHGAVLAADGHLIVLTETGTLMLAPASSEGFAPIAEMKLFEGTTYSLSQRLLRQRQGARCWSAPVLCGGRLLARNHVTVTCLDLRGAGE
jgi:outer membrane protein assembly factor BamB